MINVLIKLITTLRVSYYHFNSLNAMETKVWEAAIESGFKTSSLIPTPCEQEWMRERKLYKLLFLASHNLHHKYCYLHSS